VANKPGYLRQMIDNNQISKRKGEMSEKDKKQARKTISGFY